MGASTALALLTGAPAYGQAAPDAIARACAAAAADPGACARQVATYVNVQLPQICGPIPRGLERDDAVEAINGAAGANVAGVGALAAARAAADAAERRLEDMIAAQAALVADRDAAREELRRAGEEQATLFDRTVVLGERLAEAERAEEEATTRIEALQADNAELTGQVDSWRRLALAAEKETSTVDAAELEEAREALATARREADAAERRREALEGQVASLTDEAATLRTDVAAAKRDADAANARANALLQDAGGCDAAGATIASLRADLERVSRRRDALAEQARRLTEERDALTADLAAAGDAADSVADAESQVASLEAAVARERRASEALRRETTRLRQALETDRADAERRAAAASEEIAQLRTTARVVSGAVSGYLSSLAAEMNCATLDADWAGQGFTLVGRVESEADRGRVLASFEASPFAVLAAAPPRIDVASAGGGGACLLPLGADGRFEVAKSPTGAGGGFVLGWDEISAAPGVIERLPDLEACADALQAASAALDASARPFDGAAVWARSGRDLFVCRVNQRPRKIGPSRRSGAQGWAVVSRSNG